MIGHFGDTNGWLAWLEGGLKTPPWLFLGRLGPHWDELWNQQEVNKSIPL